MLWAPRNAARKARETAAPQSAMFVVVPPRQLRWLRPEQRTFAGRLIEVSEYPASVVEVIAVKECDPRRVATGQAKPFQRVPDGLHVLARPDHEHHFGVGIEAVRHATLD